MSQIDLNGKPVYDTKITPPWTYVWAVIIVTPILGWVSNGNVAAFLMLGALFVVLIAAIVFVGREAMDAYGNPRFNRQAKETPKGPDDDPEWLRRIGN